MFGTGKGGQIARTHCKFCSLGCPEIFPYYSKLKHESVCNFRPYNCPYAGSECSVVGDIPSLVTHLKDDHKVDMYSGCTFNHRYVKSNPRDVENATWMLTWRQMHVFLKSNDHPNADDLLMYELENVAFTWPTKKPDLDCGIFLMNNMEFFKGKVYTTPDLGKAVVRRALRTTYCARIITSDANIKKNKIREKVIEFCKKKPVLMEVEAERKKNKKKKKS